MLAHHYFNVAGFTFAVSLPQDKDIDGLLPSFVPFYEGCGQQPDDKDENLLFHFSTEAAPDASIPTGRLLEDAENDMGHVRLTETVDAYTVSLDRWSDTYTHVMHADRTFRTAQAAMQWDDPHADEALDSLLRTAYSLAVPRRNAVAVHAAAVVLDGKAYIFMGRSGTGKSTHAALWQRCFSGCRLLNDDNPTLRVCTDGTVMVYGTPWSGKTPCYRNEGYPLCGAVRLHQSADNRFTPRADVDAFTLLLPGCSAIRSDRRMLGSLYDTLTQVAVSIPVGQLDCRADEDAARLCAASLGANIRRQINRMI